MINEKITVYGKEIQNRVVIHPMEGCDGTEEGGISELTRRRYLRFAESGAGIIWFEATAVSRECRANPRQLFLNEKTMPEFRQLLNEIRETAIRSSGFAPVIILQSTNSGRWSKPNGTPEPIVAYRSEYWEKGKENQPYTVATDEYCDEIIKKYGIAASLAVKAGFDGIDVKCCHGYLMNEFLSAFDREGKYGGSFENRTRFYFSCIDEVKKCAGDKLFVTTRLNAADCFPYPNGFGVNRDSSVNLEETKKIMAVLKEKGIELINLTLGNPYLIPHINRPCKNAPESSAAGMKRIYEITREISASTDIKIIMSGLSFNGEKSVDYADECLEDGIADFAGFGRMAFCYPQFYKDYLSKGKIDKSKCCLGCAKCTELMRHGSVTGCPVRDSEVYMPLYKKYVLGE